MMDEVGRQHSAAKKRRIARLAVLILMLGTWFVMHSLPEKARPTSPADRTSSTGTGHPSQYRHAASGFHICTCGHQRPAGDLANFIR